MVGVGPMGWDPVPGARVADGRNVADAVVLLVLSRLTPFPDRSG